MTIRDHDNEPAPTPWELKARAWQTLAALRQAAAGLTRETRALEPLDELELLELQDHAQRAVEALDAIGRLTPATPPPRPLLTEPTAAKPTSTAAPLVRKDRRPTGEQEEVIEGGTRGESMVVDAGAGTGKTSTLVMMAKRMPDRGLYTTFTKASILAGQKVFPEDVTCKNAHKLAYAAVGYRYKERLNSPRLSGVKQAEILGIDEVFQVNGHRRYGPARLAEMATQTVVRWCHSADSQIEKQHVPVPSLLTPTEAQQLRDAVLPMALKAWADLSSPAGRLHFPPDVYLKLWALEEPQMGYAYVMLDEAQDSNPVLAQVVQNQRDTQLIAVGDSCQQMYEWRGAVDAMASWPAQRRLMLTQSWRFGPAAADEANRWLAKLDTSMRLKGSPHLDTRVITGGLQDPDAILCRTNGKAVVLALNLLAAGQRPTLVGGSKKVRKLAEACEELQQRNATTHPELAAFTSWDEVCEYADTPDGADLKAFVDVVNEHGPRRIIKAADAMAPDEQSASVVISTVHKAKGLEWPKVRIASDFPPPPRRENGSAGRVEPSYAMAAYVAVTRATEVLDREGLAWIDQH
ncbi:UvrD-helicase domain-containing protein [Streptomyces sp. NPDC006339]|uniref:UvrD-helicase domain-containing protein n=1 Tax=Streptomyces sp. NPDC006339 TaxID=3156755 RepID=UPI0033B39C07